MDDKLILISIGPVQDFIASARKLRDLWFGSDMLSELSKVVAKSLHEQGAELIFPHIKDESDLEPNSPLIVANKVFAKISNNCDINQVIKKAKKAWSEAQLSYATETMAEMKRIKSIKFNEDLFMAQVGDSGEFFASWVELGADYKVSKDKLEKLLAGRKNLRQFNAPTWDGTGLLKSTLDGARESVFIGKPREIRGLLKVNEYLDTLGCIKRFYPLSGGTTKHFEDLSDIALVPFLDRIYTNHELEDLLSDYESFFTNTEDGLRSKQSRKHTKTELNIQSDYLYANDEQDLSHLADSKGAWRALQKLTHRNRAGSPPKYACILMGDGDNMGQALDKISNYTGHQVFSENLARFTKEVEILIGKYDGSLIYAGGDDVMAYLPLHTAVKCSDEIRLLFLKYMNEIFSALKLPKKDLPTFSIGLAIVHHSCPLDQALILARKAESMAKKEGGRNALAIIQSKRSGSDLSIFGKWDAVGETLGMASKVEKMIELYNDEKKSLPHTLGYQLRQARIECGDTLDFKMVDQKLIPKNAASVTALRIFEQKKESDNLKDLLTGHKSLRKLSDELVIARQIAEVVKMSKDQIEENK